MNLGHANISFSLIIGIGRDLIFVYQKLGGAQIILLCIYLCAVVRQSMEICSTSSGSLISSGVVPFRPSCPPILLLDFFRVDVIFILFR
jgi:hypothetical protein